MTTMQREFSDDAHTYISAAAAATEDYAGGGCPKGYFMPTYAIYLLTSTSIPRSFTIAIHPWLLAEGGRIWSFISEGTDSLEEEQIPILFVEMCYYVMILV